MLEIVIDLQNLLYFLQHYLQLLKNADDGSFLTITGFNRAAFRELELAIFPIEDVIRAGVKRGRPESLDNKGKLGVYLLYTTSRMEVKHLCMIFGVPPTTCIRYINKMMKLQQFVRIAYVSIRVFYEAAYCMIILLVRYPRKQRRSWNPFCEISLCGSLGYSLHCDRQQNGE